MENGEDKDGGLAHAGLGLAEDVYAYHCMGDALLLHLGGVLEGAVLDSSLQLGLEKQVFETCRVHTSVSSQPIIWGRGG